MPENAKPRPPYGSPFALPKEHPRFYRPPAPPAGTLAMKLSDLSTEAHDRVAATGELVFQCVGDTGNDSGHSTQDAIASAMVQQREHLPDPERPSFFYHLGDVVYPLGESRHYDERFYKRYKFYDPPIVSIPGNHDGYGSQNNPATTLDGWKQHFLGTLPQDQWFPYRHPLKLPHVYWALETPVAWILGLYSNVDGYLDDPKPGAGTPQQDWLVAQLRAIPGNMPILLMVHHPPYSFDGDHHGSPAIAEALDQAAKKAGRWPDAVFSGHVHAYQRFTRVVDGRQIPYVVAGSGGRADKRADMEKPMQWPDEMPVQAPFVALDKGAPMGLELVADDWNDPGYLLISVTSQQLTCQYYRVPFDEGQAIDWQDAFTLDFGTHQIVDH